MARGHFRYSAVVGRGRGARGGGGGRGHERCWARIRESAVSLSVRVRAPRRGYKDLGSRYLYAAVVLFTTVAEKYIRVFRSRFAVRRHLCLAFFVRASRFAVRSHLCLAFHVRASRFALSHSRFVLSRSCFAVRSSQFVVRGSWWFWNRVGALSSTDYFCVVLKCAEQSECPVRRVTVDGVF